MNDNKLKEKITTFAPNGELFTFWKGRIALYCFLKSLNLTYGDEVILPAMTCVVVPNAIIYAGLVPIYIDIDADTFNINTANIEEKVTNKTKVIIIQNTFGLSSDIEKVMAIAKKHKLITIDDCTHGFGGKYNNAPNGSLTDAVFYSSQWNKPISTVIGGYLMVSAPKLIENVKKEYIKYNKPTIIENIKLLILFYIKKWTLNQATYWPLLKLYRWLSKNNLILGSSQKEELIDVKKPKDYEKRMGWFQKKRAIKEISILEGKLHQRKKNAAIITNWLKENNKIHVKDEYISNHSWLKYPIRVNQRSIFMKKAESNKIPLGDWFVSPIHPVQTNYEKWYFEEKKCKQATSASKELVNLPTDFNQMKSLVLFLEDVKDHIL